MSLIKSWDDAHSNGKKPGVVAFDHGLNETGMFSDDALAHLLDTHPTDLVDVRTRSQEDHPEFPDMLRTGDFRDVSGKDLIAAAQDGWIWINMRQVMNVQPDYKKLLDEMYEAYNFLRPTLGKSRNVTIKSFASIAFWPRNKHRP